MFADQALKMMLQSLMQIYISLNLGKQKNFISCFCAGMVLDSRMLFMLMPVVCKSTAYGCIDLNYILLLSAGRTPKIL